MLGKKNIITNESRLERLMAEMKNDGPDKFHVLADFDRTLTYAFVNGEEVPSIISVLRSEGYLTSTYPEQAQELFNKYHPIEINREITAQEKKQAMREWWSKHFELLIKSGLSQEDVKKAVTSQKLRLRLGAHQLFNYLHSKSIPLVIMSSSGLGVESISYYLENQNLLTDNIHIISNQFIWNDQGQAVSVKEPIIHSLNKDETSIHDFPACEQIKERKNVLLLGDNPEDTGMIEGFTYENLITIGFLNKNIDENLELYKKTYNIVISGDGDLEFVNELLSLMFGQ